MNPKRRSLSETLKRTVPAQRQPVEAAQLIAQRSASADVVAPMSATAPAVATQPWTTSRVLALPIAAVLLYLGTMATLAAFDSAIAPAGQGVAASGIFGIVGFMVLGVALVASGLKAMQHALDR